MRRRLIQRMAATALVPTVAAASLSRTRNTGMNEHVRKVDAGGLGMRVVDRGDGPAVLLCHGFPETAHAWRHQVAALAEAGYRAIAPDMRGYGGTDAPEPIGSYTVFDSVGDLVKLLDALEVPEATIVGNDWGATVAWQAALMRPDRFTAVVGVGVPLMGRAPARPTTLFPKTADAMFYTLYFQRPDIAEAELERDVGTSLRKIVFAASGDAGPRRAGDDTPNPFAMVSTSDGMLAGLSMPSTMPDWLPPGDLDEFVAAFTASGFRGGLNYYRNLDRNWELQRAYDGLPVSVPAQYIVGERDPGRQIPGMDRIVAGMAGLAPRLRPAIVVESSGHWVPQERPREFNAALVGFLGSL